MPGARKRGRPPSVDVLTSAEWRVVEAVCHGLTNLDIARRQSVNLDAIKYRFANAPQTLGLAIMAQVGV